MGKKAPKWRKTPFNTLEGAHQVAERMELRPSAIVDTGGDFRSFTIREGRNVTLVAQRSTGPVLEKTLGKGQVPPQDPSAPYFHGSERLRVSPWLLSDHTSLEDVECHWRKQFVNFENVEVLQIVLYRIGNDEYEYGLDSTGKIWQRVLSGKGK